MRTTDPDPKPFRPLGEKVPRQAPPTTPAPRRAQEYTGIVVGPDGRLHTSLPLP